MTTVFYGINKTSPGPSLSSFWSRRTEVAVTPLSISFSSPRYKSKKKIYEHVTKMWEEEWAGSTNGECTRSFFPNTQSAVSLISLLMDRASAQIVSGHNMLNSHQHRFGFTRDASCACGHLSETISHFLYFCPLFISQRNNFKTASLSLTGVWPPPVSMIPQQPELWNVIRQFVRHTGRLKYTPLSGNRWDF
jgi:hypothetical protein